ncbi:MAG TPA: hypothetical protein P5107_06175 [Thermotogota bacterium]|nr:hypothetical protein [Thermotogota bacterium]
MKGWILKSSLIIILIVLAVFLYIIGKEHVIFVENNTFISGEKVYEPYEIVRVTLDGGEPVEIKKPKGRSLGRSKVSTTGLNHSILVEILDDDDQVIEKKEAKFSVKNSEAELLLNIPAFMNDAEGWVANNQKTIYVENKPFTADGKTYEPYEFVRVILDRSKSLEIKKPGDGHTGMDSGVVTDLRHTLYIEIMDENETVLESKEVSYTVEHAQVKLLINIPAVMYDLDGWITDYED